MYLLDINVLLAFRYTAHTNHLRAVQWVDFFRSKAPTHQPFATCAIVDLGLYESPQVVPVSL